MGALFDLMILMPALWIFVPLFANLLFVALFRKKISRLLTIGVGFLGGIVGAKLWVEVFGRGDPGYTIISSLVLCLLSAASMSFLQVIRQLPQDDGNESAQNNINEQSEDLLTPDPSPARGEGSKH